MGCASSKGQGRIVSLSMAPLADARGSRKTSTAPQAEAAEPAPLPAAEAAALQPEGQIPVQQRLAAPPVPIQLVDPRTFPTEPQRQAVLLATRVIDTPPETRFDAITELMGTLFQTPVSLITLLVEDRVWFKSKWGPMGSCVARDGSWCNWALVPTSPEVMICEDSSRDARFACSPYVKGPPFIKFYGGAPLVGKGGMRYGTLCVVDLRPRAFSAEMYSLLGNFAHLAVQELERDMGLIDKLACPLAGVDDIEFHERFAKDLSRPTEAVLLLDTQAEPWKVLYANDAFAHKAGAADVVSCAPPGTPFWERFAPASLEHGAAVELPGQERVAMAVAAGHPARLAVRCVATGRELRLVLCPASSDLVFPEKATGVPNWVPSELAPSRVGGSSPAGPSPQPGALLGADGGTAGGTSAEGTGSLPPTSSFWFAIVESEPDQAAAPPAAGAAAAAAAGGQLPPGMPAPAAAAAAAGDAGSSSAASPGTPSLRGSQRGRRLGTPGSAELVTYVGHRPPSELVGELQLGPLIGAGSYGKVYRALWCGCRPVAVKVVECRRDSREAHDALQEARMSQKFDHPNVVKTYQHALQVHSPRECSVWIVQQLCTHGTLREAAEVGLLREERSLGAPPDMRRILRCLMEVARGMAYLHSKGVMHRDLNGNNVLLDGAEPTAEDPRAFTCRIGDFGMARIVEDEGAATATFGTVTHAAPEVLAEGVLTHSSDAWSFGVIAWECYTGIRAHCGLPAPTVIYRITTGKGALELPPTAPPAFQEMVAACLDMDHARRPSFASLASSLEEMLARQLASSPAGAGHGTGGGAGLGVCPCSSSA